MLKLKNQVITALDIGSSKICAIIAEVDQERQLPLIKGFGAVPSKGINKGLVIDIEQVTDSIIKALTIAEEMAGFPVESCIVSISGEHIRSMNTKGMVAISSDNRTGLGESREIEEEDIASVIEHTKAVPLPIERQILHVLSQEFIVDEQSGVKNPLNLSGRRLEAKVHLTTYSTTAASNLAKCIKNAGLEVEGFVFSAFAASYACLEESEKEMGSILLDIGSGIVDVIVFYESGVHYTGVINLGAANVTHDISIMLRIPPVQAEQLKREYGFAKTSLTDKEAFFKLNGIAGRQSREVAVYNLAEWIEPRMEEILREAFNEASKADIPLTNILSVTLVGGGALLKGTDELTEMVFNTPTKVGTPKGFEGYETELSDPSYAVAIGLLKYAVAEFGRRGFRGKSGGPIKRFSSWIKHLTENIM